MVMMAIWVIEHTDSEGETTLRWSSSAVPSRLAWQPCGACAQNLTESLLAWVVEEAEHGDQIQTPDGLFVKLLGPGGRPAQA